MGEVTVHTSSHCLWHCCFLTLAWEDNRLTLYRENNGMFSLLRVTRMSKTVPRTGVFILVGAIFFMEWNLIVFSAPIKLSMLADMASLETLHKLVSLFLSTLCDFHFIFLYSIDYPDTYIISLFHYPTISNFIYFSPSTHPSTNLSSLLYIKYTKAC